MVLLCFFEGRLLGPTDIFDIETARVKTAPFGRVDGTGDIASQNNPFSFRSGVRGRGGGQQCLGIGVQGSLIEFIAVGEFHDFTKVHNGYPVADVLYNAQVVGYEQVGQVEFFLQILKKIDDLGLD